MLAPPLVHAQGSSSDSATKRDVGKAAPQRRSSGHFNRWAVVIGVSHYKDKTLDLKYADRDAEGLYEVLQTPSGGGFEKDKMLLLTNDSATTSNVTRGLRSFLKRPAREDLVIIYFAGHGAPDPDRPKNLYLLTYDTKREDIAGTALPMRELEISIRENLLAERVVLMIDACHSGGLGGDTGRRDVFDNAAVLNAYLDGVASARPGTAVLTSAEATETAGESERWGGGHGVFTYYLLEGLKGQADASPRDGIVTVGELFEYVREKVKDATGGQQHPAIDEKSSFDRNLPMAITSGLAAREHQELGRLLMDLGSRLQDEGRFESANRQFDEALRLTARSHLEFSPVSFDLGRSLLARGEYLAAQDVLSPANQTKNGTQVGARRLAGVAQMLAGKEAAAAKTFQEFLTTDPNDEYAPLLRAYLRRAAEPPSATGRRRALLIGINRYRDAVFPELGGCLNDVVALRDVLMHRYGFSDVRMLIDTAATQRNISDALRELARTSASGDVVFVHYSGMGFRADSAGENRLVTHDTRTADGGDRARALGTVKVGSGIADSVLHRWLSAIPAERVIFSLDGIPSLALHKLAANARYTLLEGSAVGQMPAEGPYPSLNVASSDLPDRTKPLTDTTRAAARARPEDSMKVMGAFAWALVGALLDLDSTSASPSSIYSMAAKRLLTRSVAQNIQISGGLPNTLLTAANDDPFRSVFEMVARPDDPRKSPENLAPRYAWLATHFAGGMPELRSLFGHAYLARGDFARALAILDSAEQAGPLPPSARFDLDLARIRGGRFAAARSSLQTQLDGVSRPLSESMASAIVRLGRMTKSPKHALLVGIDGYRHLANHPRGAAADARALQRILIARFGFAPANVQVLLDSAATRATIMSAVKALALSARDEPVLLYFAGLGSTTRAQMTIVPADGRNGGIDDIPLSDLASLFPPDSSHAATIIDSFGKDRTAPPDTSVAIGRRGISQPDVAPDAPQIGFLTLYAAIPFSRGPATQEIETVSALGGKERRGEFTDALVQRLSKEKADIPWSDLVPGLGGLDNTGDDPKVRGSAANVPLFGYAPWAGNDMVSSLRRAEAVEPLSQAIELLKRLIDQRRDNYPEGYLNLGIAYAARGDSTQAVVALERAIAEDGASAEAHYWLGRTLYETDGDMTRAVSELRDALRLAPDLAAADYYLGYSLRAVIEKETSIEVRKAFETYLAHGAPLGHDADVSALVRELRTARPSAQRP